MKKSKNKLKALLTIFLLLTVGTVISIAFIVTSLLKPVSKETTSPVKFVIPKGQAISIIGQRLTDKGLIKNPLIFRFVVTKDKLANKIQAGSFDISSSMNVSEIAEHLTTGTEDVWITILEGWRAEEIAESLDAAELDSFDKEEFLVLARASEGMLFPDTYLIPREMTSEAIYHLLINTFEQKVSKGLWDEIQASDKDFDDILIMASLVEREARTFPQMQRVAGILWNRIDIGMALQVDATLQYVNGYSKIQKKWWAVPSSADKKQESPFNTYLNPGLPPNPIANPSLNAIKATLDPLASDDLFYIHSNDGAMYYSATLDGHNSNINKYLR